MLCSRAFRASLVHLTPPTVSNLELPLSKPSIEPRRITAEELQLFRTPDNLLGKQFILSPGTDESGMFEVTYSKKRDGTIQYEVLSTIVQIPSR